MSPPSLDIAVPAGPLGEPSTQDAGLRQESEASLHRALERGEFALHYQPKVDLTSRAITGGEALLRWSHPSRGLIGPADFLPEAERCGLMPAIGNWVVREACRQARAWQEQGLPEASVAVNVSAVQFTGEGFLRSVIDILDETRLDPALLEVELSETVLRAHGDEMTFVLQVLRSTGVSVAIDRFGSVDASLSSLGRYPITSLKVDRSFMGRVATSQDAERAMNAVIAGGHDLNLRLVAEGVETSEQLGGLSARRFDEAQGYVFSRPVDPADFASLLAHGLPQGGRR